MIEGITPDLALVYAVLQAGQDGFFLARDLGVRSEQLHDESKKVYALFERYMSKKRLPSESEIAVETGVAIEVPEEPFDVEVMAKSIAKRALIQQLEEGLGPIIREELRTDPEEARTSLHRLAQETAWSTGRAASSADPAIIKAIREDYLRTKSLDGGLLGLSSPWDAVNRSSLGLQAGELTVLLAKRKKGKCLAAGTPITDPGSGLQVPIEQFVRESSRNVLTWGENKPIHSVRPAAYVDTGTKECLKITWRSGRILIATPEHPLMTPTGWKRLDTLQEGHHTAAAAKLPEPTQPRGDYPRHYLSILAFMIAEGGCTKPSTPTFTSNVPAIVNEMRKALAEEKHQLTPVKQRAGNYYVTREGDGPNKVVKFLGVHGLMEKRSIEKEIPELIFRLTNDLLAVFLGRLWSCDGTVEKSGVVSYSTGSRKLADQVQHLLLRFGVTSRVKTTHRKVGDAVRDYYEVIIRRERIENFKRAVGKEMIGPKFDRLKKVTFKGRSRVGWIRNEEIKDLIYSELEEDPSLLQDIGEELGYSFKFQKGHIFDSTSRRVRRKVFSAFCEVYDSPLKWLLDDNIEWDEIVMVEPVGEQRVFDLTVLPTHCFVANDVIVHNTWCALKWWQHIWRNDLKPGECLLIVTMEMPTVQMYRRLFAIDLHLDYEKFRNGDLGMHERRFLDWADRMMDPDPDEPVVRIIGSDKCRSVEDVAAKTAELQPRGVMVDGFYILGRGGKAKGMWERTMDNVAGLKLDVCGALGVPLLATTQLKGSKKGDDLDADSDDAAYAKAIGDWADATYGLFANDMYEANRQRILRGMEAREFETISIQMNFDLCTMDFNQIKALDRGEVPTLEEAGPPLTTAEAAALAARPPDAFTDEEPIDF